MADRPNVLVILNDDMGYSDLGCYGGEIDTPNLNALAQNGLRFTQFYNTARCCPSRACLLTGLHPHQTGIGILTGRDGPDGYEGNLSRNNATLAEVLRAAGYGAYMSGKWHVCSDQSKPNGSWPLERGFEKYFGIITGGADYFAPKTLHRDHTNIDAEAKADPNFYLTDAISDNACRFIREHRTARPEAPFFLYTAYTSPHWPLHAKPQDIARYKGRFDAGWDKLREARLARMRDMGLLDRGWALSERDPAQPPWTEAQHKEWQLRRMEVYAAQIDCMDQGIGRILQTLKDTGQLENTLIVFLADNGGCAEELASGWRLERSNIANQFTKDGKEVKFGNNPEFMPGSEETYQSYGVPWANLSNTPFRYYKHWVHEGGIATPFIMHWPRGIGANIRGQLRHQPAQLTDIMPTIVELTGAAYPRTNHGHSVPPMEGTSMAPLLENRPNGKQYFFWEHEGNAAARLGKWKLVKNFTAARSATPGFDPPGQRGAWELYDMDADRTELHDLAAQHPERVKEMAAAYEAWAKRCGVIDREVILRQRR